MALKPCRECGRDVSTEAASCPHCGAADPTGEVAARQAAVAAVGQRRQTRVFVGCAVIAILFVTCLAVNSSDEWSTAAQGPTDFDAWWVCKEAIALRLKAPATAQFSPSHESRIDRVGQVGPYQNVWTVRGAVDAQNGFGALIRSAFWCRLDHLGGERFAVIEARLLE